MNTEPVQNTAKTDERHALIVDRLKRLIDDRGTNLSQVSVAIGLTRVALNKYIVRPGSLERHLPALLAHLGISKAAFFANDFDAKLQRRQDQVDLPRGSQVIRLADGRYALVGPIMVEAVSGDRVAVNLDGAWHERRYVHDPVSKIIIFFSADGATRAFPEEPSKSPEYRVVFGFVTDVRRV